MTPAGTPGEEPGDAGGLLLPPGLGTLHQDQISLRLQSGDLLIKITPLDEGIIRLTAPDTYERLRGLVGIYGAEGGRNELGIPIQPLSGEPVQL